MGETCESVSETAPLGIRSPGRRVDQARVALEQLLAHAPEVSCAKFAGNPMFGGAQILERFIALLREAGPPDGQ